MEGADVAAGKDRACRWDNRRLRLAGRRLLDGVIDIYMPEFQILGERTGPALLRRPGLPGNRARRFQSRTAVAAPDATWRHSKRGLLLRHLVMPGPGEAAGTGGHHGVGGARAGRDTHVNLMAQHRRAGRVRHGEFPKSTP